MDRGHGKAFNMLYPEYNVKILNNKYSVTLFARFADLTENRLTNAVPTRLPEGARLFHRGRCHQTHKSYDPHIIDMNKFI